MLEVERKNIAEVQRERIAVEKNVAEEEERIKDLRVVSEANRQKDELVIKAKVKLKKHWLKILNQQKRKSKRQSIPQEKCKPLQKLN